MRVLRKAPSLAFAVFACVGLFGCSSESANSQSAVASPPVAKATWSTNFFEARQQAKKENKLLLAVFSAKWCKPCQDLHNQALDSPELAQATKDMVLVTVDVDEYKSAADGQGVGAIPDARIYNANGDAVLKTVGYGGLASFLSFVQEGRMRASAK